MIPVARVHIGRFSHDPAAPRPAPDVRIFHHAPDRCNPELS